MNKIKRFIVEGADQQGKSTICAYLKFRLSWKVVHFPKPPKGFDFHDDYLLPENTISDRSFLSEIVYAKIDGRAHRIPKLQELKQTIANSNTVLIILDRGDNFEFESRREDYTEKQIRRAQIEYRKMYPTPIATYLINPDTQMLLIEKLIERC